MKQFATDKLTISMEKAVYAAARTYAKEDRIQSWFHFWIMIVSVACSYLILFVSSNLFISFITGVVLSLLLVRLFVIYHDYVHKTILHDAFVARIFFTFFGWFILAPISIWKRSHNHHHQHNSKLDAWGIGSFPILTRSEYLDCSRSKRLAYLLTRHPVSIVLGYFVTFLFGMCLRSFVQNSKKHWDSLLALVVHTGLGSMIFLGGGIELFVCTFLLPALVSGCIGSYLFFAQHNYPGVIHHRKEDWSNYKAAITSSSYIKMNWLMEWFTANIGYHHIHHLNAAIPFYNLPKVHHELPQLKPQVDTTLLPLDILKCLRLKLWDPCLNRMIGMEDLRPLNLKDDSGLLKPILHGLSN